MVVEGLPDGQAVFFGKVEGVELFNREEAQSEVFRTDLQLVGGSLGEAAVDEDQHIDRIHNIDLGGREEGANGNVNVHFFPDLAGKALGDVFSLLEFAAGQVPLPAFVLQEGYFVVNKAYALDRDGITVGKEV